ncbi:MAG TPA: hypothetical protein VK791_11850 [bacterium]|nr:hypothetical protein [bacterium]
MKFSCIELIGEALIQGYRSRTALLMEDFKCGTEVALMNGKVI